jgi:hypothetical protein
MRYSHFLLLTVIITWSLTHSTCTNSLTVITHCSIPQGYFNAHLLWSWVTVTNLLWLPISSMQQDSTHVLTVLISHSNMSKTSNYFLTVITHCSMPQRYFNAHSLWSWVTVTYPLWSPIAVCHKLVPNPFTVIISHRNMPRLVPTFSQWFTIVHRVTVE